MLVDVGGVRWTIAAIGQDDYIAWQKITGARAEMEAVLKHLT